MNFYFKIYQFQDPKRPVLHCRACSIDDFGMLLDWEWRDIGNASMMWP